MRQKLIVTSEEELRSLIRECLEELQLTETPREFLSGAEAMELLNIKRTSLHHLVTNGHISIVRVGKRNGILYRRSSILNYLEQKTEHAFRGREFCNQTQQKL